MTGKQGWLLHDGIVMAAMGMGIPEKKRSRFYSIQPFILFSLLQSKHRYLESAKANVE